MKSSLIPFVCGAGASTPGAEFGPLYCYDQGLDQKLRHQGIDASWAFNPHLHWESEFGQSAHRDLPPRGHARRSEIVSWHLRNLAANVRNTVAQGYTAVTIGGDHSMAAASIAGLQLADSPVETIGLIWVDAHTDLHTFISSTSKALHGMPVGSLLGLDTTLSVPDTLYPVLKPENVLYAGLRDIDPEEIEHAKTLGIPIPSMEDLRRQGITELLTEKIAALKSRCTQIVLSIDLDAFSHEIAPSVGTMVPGGFFSHEIMPLLIDVVRTHEVPLIEVVEFNPTLSEPEKTYQLLVEILSGLLAAQDR